ncbi:MAG: hypothetical protein ACUVTU_09405 [Desulfurispora sp.]|uniref:hypothetical protein n=1 Tax=Desulfurispora sp. TaxID=3014275 RepID=UPI0040490E5D
MSRNKLGGIWALALLIWLAAALPGQAGVLLEVTPGLGGIYKGDTVLPLQIQITNQDSGPLQGEIRLEKRVARGKVPQELPYDYRLAVQLSPGERRIYNMVLSPEMSNFFNYGDGDIYVVLESAGRVLGRVRPGGTNVQGGRVCLVGEMELLNSPLVAYLNKQLGNSLTVKYLPPEKLPVQGAAWDNADWLVASPAQLAALDSTRSQILKQWLARGGVLVLPGPGHELPPDLSALQEHLYNRLDIPGGGQLKTYLYGRGFVLTADRSLSALAALPAELWSAWLPLAEEKVKNALSAQSAFLADQAGYWPLPRLVRAGTLFALWLVYLLLVGPGLYWLLKRRGRTAWMWPAVPALALLTALAIYLANPLTRVGGYRQQTLALVDVQTARERQVHLGAAVFLSRGGRLILQSGPGFLLWPGFGDRTEGVLVQQRDEEQTISYSNVPYSSQRRLQGGGYLSGQGQIQATLHFTGDILTGTLTNTTGVDLYDCYLTAGGHRIALGEIKDGQSKQVAVRPGDWIVDGPWRGDVKPVPEAVVQQQYEEQRRRMESELAGGQQEDSLLEDWRRRQMLDVAQPGEGLYFWGWSRQEVPAFKVQQPGGGSGQQLVLWRQRLYLGRPGEAFGLPAGTLLPASVVNQTPTAREEVYNLAEILGSARLRLTGLQLAALPELAGRSVKIYNQQKKTWQPVELPWRVDGAAAGQYLLPGGRLKLLITAVEKDVPQRGLLSVQGVVER